MVKSKPCVRVYIACSLDGFIAGPGDDLSWLPGAQGDSPELALAGHDTAQDPGAVGFEEFMADVGALLMGRRTYDVVAGFEGDWPYGETPVLVATHRIITHDRGDVRPVSGDIQNLMQAARDAAGEKDIYLDGGELIRQALDADLVDELIVTLVPVLLGKGHTLFAGVTRRHKLEFVGNYRFSGGMVQLHCRPETRLQ